MRWSPIAAVLLSSSSALAAPAGFTLAPAPWSLALDGVAGNGVLFTGSRDDAHPALGGMARLRVDLVELGAYADWTPHETLQSRGVGAMAGVFLPYRRWLDFELAVTLGKRRFTSGDARYGPDGFGIDEWTAGARAGVSARAGSLFAARVGAMLALVTSPTTHTVSWRWAADRAGHLVTQGTRTVGGTDVMLLFTIGLDVTPGPLAPRSPGPFFRRLAPPATGWYPARVVRFDEADREPQGERAPSRRASPATVTPITSCDGKARATYELPIATSTWQRA